MREFPPQETGEEFARRLDLEDPLASYREEFCFPQRGQGAEPVLYLCGHSLGLQPKSARQFVAGALDEWATLGVEGHFVGPHPFYSYHLLLKEPAARILGALPDEVVMMNSLTVNLHLMLASFYQPQGDRKKILVAASNFPSDRFAIESHLRFRGYDEQNILRLPARDETGLSEQEAIEELLTEHGSTIALVVLEGVHYLSSQAVDIARITELAHKKGCLVGFDLAHAAGNIPLRLHDWDVDFAVFCSYKYLNGGPGGVGGCFVHMRHHRKPELPRLTGWWGHDPASRFVPQVPFKVQDGAEGWQISNAPILSMAACRASFELFDRVGMTALREKSEALTGYFEFLVDRIPGRPFAIVSPREPQQRGCALSLRSRIDPAGVHAAISAGGAICDLRGDLLRAAPVPFYNSFLDVWRFVQILKNCAQVSG